MQLLPQFLVHPQNIKYQYHSINCIEPRQMRSGPAQKIFIRQLLKKLSGFSFCLPLNTISMFEYILKCYHYFSASEAFDGTYPTNVVVTSSGSCTYIPPGIFMSTCKIDITWFPFDDQNCEMKFGSWTYNGFKVNI